MTGIYIGSAIVGLAGVFLLLMGLLARRRQALSRSWPETTAQIRSTGVRTVSGEDSDTYIPEVIYDYEVDSKLYTAKRIKFGSVTCYSEPAARHALKKYPVNASVPVFYDPTNPGWAVLERSPGGTAFVLAVGSVMLAVGAALPFVFARS